jgi:hypothetical protein
MKLKLNNIEIDTDELSQEDKNKLKDKFDEIFK